MCFFLAGPCPGAGLALEEEAFRVSTGLFVATGDAERVALVSESTRATETPPALSLSELSSELSSDEEELELLESEGGRGVFVACFRALESAFWADFFSEPEESESEDSESEESLELPDSLLELLELPSLDESDSEDEESDESESDLVGGLTSATLAFLALGSSSDESESELDSEEEELLDSAFRFTPVSFFAAGAGVGAASSSSSSSSSASLSELEEEEDDDEEEGDDARDALISFLGASFISTSESLSSLSELELELSDSLLELELLGLGEDEALAADLDSHDLNSSNKDGAFFTFVGVLPAAFKSFSKAALAPENPLSERKVETAASSWGETLDEGFFASFCRESPVSDFLAILICNFEQYLFVRGLLDRAGFLGHGCD